MPEKMFADHAAFIKKMDWSWQPDAVGDDRASRHGRRMGTLHTNFNSLPDGITFEDLEETLKSITRTRPTITPNHTGGGTISIYCQDSESVLANNFGIEPATGRSGLPGGKW